mgnify:CR=1 FL=1
MQRRKSGPDCLSAASFRAVRSASYGHLTLLRVVPTACPHKAGFNEPCSVRIADFRIGRLTAMMYWRDAAHDADFIVRVREKAAALFDSGVNLAVTGVAAINSGIINTMMTSLAIGYSTGFLLITVLMIVAVGDLRLGLLAMIPNLMPIVIGLGVMGFADLLFQLQAEFQARAAVLELQHVIFLGLGQGQVALAATHEGHLGGQQLAPVAYRLQAATSHPRRAGPCHGGGPQRRRGPAGPGPPEPSPGTAAASAMAFCGGDSLTCAAVAADALPASAVRRLRKLRRPMGVCRYSSYRSAILRSICRPPGHLNSSASRYKTGAVAVNLPLHGK